MFTSLIPVVAGFILSGLIGNRLLQHWQNRNWISQQRFNSNEKEYAALKELIDEIAQLLGERIYLSQRILLSVAEDPDEKFESKVLDYDDIIKRWNIRLTSFYVRLSLLISEGEANMLERSIQDPMKKLSDVISRLLKKRLESKEGLAQEARAALKSAIVLQANATNFNKRLLDLAINRKKVLYEGEEITFTQANLTRFSTWFLFKALFSRNVNSLTIIRSTLNS
ncbi:hypothetical protein RJO15_22130 [Herbaspirillum huttiense F1]|jgi:hypothetical protein|uniref:hypothetical protein n=1 Tax=Herbaspirillum TaxID=963 RepID=UPI001066B404|nr:MULTISPECIES: hypothetical protein [Herbaspirillum]MDR6742818.1 hypothetical protein [Herbaspirillum sp. 1173]MDT0358502.1 hypothetical protein [Herbaspirillum huttiense F1]